MINTGGNGQSNQNLDGQKKNRVRGGSSKKHDRNVRTTKAPEVNYGTNGRPAGEPEGFSDYNIIYQIQSKRN